MATTTKTGENTTSATKAPTKTVKKVNVSKKYKGDEIVTIRSAYNGRLIVYLTKAGYEIEFTQMGDEVDIELTELRTLRSKNPKYFIKNWLEIDDPEILEYIGATQFYKNYISTDELNTLFNLPIDEMVEKIKSVSDGQRETITFKAMELVDKGIIDSRQQISALEEVLGTKLIELN